MKASVVMMGKAEMVRAFDLDPEEFTVRMSDLWIYRSALAFFAALTDTSNQSQSIRIGCRPPSDVVGQRACFIVPSIVPLGDRVLWTIFTMQGDADCERMKDGTFGVGIPDASIRLAAKQLVARKDYDSKRVKAQIDALLAECAKKGFAIAIDFSTGRGFGLEPPAPIAARDRATAKSPRPINGAARRAKSGQRRR